MTALTIADCLRNAERALAGHSDSPRLDAEVLLGQVLEHSRTALRVHGADTVADEHRRAFDGLIVRRVGGVPVAYLTGVREFWSLTLAVTPDVLVPRPDTELLVEQALLRLPADQSRSVLDLGTGSGAVALAIASERPRSRVTGVDISTRALAVATANSQKLGFTQIDWRSGSWFDAVPGERFDLIVANPPYVPSADPALRQLAAEPILALAPGPTGLEALAAITRAAGAHLHRGGCLLLEHGGTQADEVARLLALGGFRDVSSHSDLSGIPRVTLGTVHSSHQE